VRILVCDDHRLFLEAVGHAFGARGHEVVALLTDLDDAVEQATTLRPDVVVLDLGFPDGDGLEAVRAVREQVPEAQVLVLTGSVDPTTAWSVLHAGAQGMVGKDQPVEKVFHALDQLALGFDAFDLALLRGSPSPSRTVDGGDRHMAVSSLTPRERDVLRRLLRAETTRQIAGSMGITTSTARAYVQTVLTKLGVHSRVEAVSLVARLGLTGGLDGLPD
jgi:two-component system nitrate/nitrite response regulator NarL